MVARIAGDPPVAGSGERGPPAIWLVGVWDGNEAASGRKPGILAKLHGCPKVRNAGLEGQDGRNRCVLLGVWWRRRARVRPRSRAALLGACRRAGTRPQPP